MCCFYTMFRTYGARRRVKLENVPIRNDGLALRELASLMYERSLYVHMFPFSHFYLSDVQSNYWQPRFDNGSFNFNFRSVQSLLKLQNLRLNVGFPNLQNVPYVLKRLRVCGCRDKRYRSIN